MESENYPRTKKNITHNHTHINIYICSNTYCILFCTVTYTPRKPMYFSASILSFGVFKILTLPAPGSLLLAWHIGARVVLSGKSATLSPWYSIFRFRNPNPNLQWLGNSHRYAVCIHTISIGISIICYQPKFRKIHFKPRWWSQPIRKNTCGNLLQI